MIDEWNLPRGEELQGDPEPPRPGRLRRIWQDHSLTVTMCVAGLGVMAISYVAFEAGKEWDLVSGVGLGMFTTGLLLLASGPLREKNRPED